MNGQEMYLCECTACVVTFGVETAYEDHSQINCPICGSDEHFRDSGCGVVTITREPEIEA